MGIAWCVDVVCGTLIDFLKCIETFTHVHIQLTLLMAKRYLWCMCNSYKPISPTTLDIQWQYQWTNMSSFEKPTTGWCVQRSCLFKHGINKRMCCLYILCHWRISLSGSDALVFEQVALWKQYTSIDLIKYSEKFNHILGLLFVSKTYMQLCKLWPHLPGHIVFCWWANNDFHTQYKNMILCCKY